MSDKTIVKFRELFSDKYGKYLVASRNISSGEVIFREKPIAVGPASFNTNHLCFNCLRVVSSIRISCSDCKIAVFCSENCQGKRSSHSVEECQLLQEESAQEVLKNININSILLPVKLLLIQRKDPDLWEKILRLESHVEIRRSLPVWKECEKNILGPLNQFKGFGTLDQNISDVVQQLCGILDVNSFELRSPGSFDESALRGLYLQGAMMAHNCQGNTHLVVDDEFQLTIYASKTIDEGEPIFFNYTSPLLSTAERREHLREGKYFECDCQRCQDPEELGANLNTILCPKCRDGLIRFEGPSEIHRYSIRKYWKCKKCQKNFAGCLIKSCLELGKSKIESVDPTDEKELEVLLKDLSSTFNTNHFLMLNVKQKLMTIYRNTTAISSDPKKKILCRLIQLCKEILQVLEVIEPGISRLKGIILYELHVPIVILANRDYSAREISPNELKMKLEEAERYLKRSLSMLLLEPTTTPEGLLTRTAFQQYKLLKQNLNDVKVLSNPTKK